MEEVIILELLEKSGKVRERRRLSDFPVRLGRAYDNDVILDDEYVSPHHLVIERDDQGALRIADQDSENGVYQWPSHRKITSLPVASDNQLLLGSTHLRIRRTDFAVAPTVPTNHTRRAVQRLLNHFWLFALLLLAVAGIWWTKSYAMAFQKIKYQDLAWATLVPVLMLLIWAGIWAFIGRILVHRAAYVAHANMVLMCMLALFGLDYLVEYYSFAFSADSSARLMEALTSTLAGGLLLFGQLQIASQLRPKTSAATSGAVAGSLLGIALFSSYIDDSQFSTTLSYPAALKPASSMLTLPQSPEAFFAGASSMKAQLEKDRLADD